MSELAANEWLKAAKDDLLLVSKVLEEKELTNLVAFHCRQAIEKTLKALMEYNNIIVPRKHDLITLKDMLSDFVDIQEVGLLDSLNSLYIDSRYPGNMGMLPDGKPSVEQGIVFSKLSNEIYDKVVSLII